MEPNKKKKIRIPIPGGMNGTVLAILVLLSGIGLIMLYSATAYSDSIRHGGNSFYTTCKQLMYTMLAFAAMFAVSRIDYHIWRKLAKFMYPAAVVLGIAVLFFGKEVNGQKRWFAIGPLSFQPAEFAKLTLILTLASLMDLYYGMLKYYRVMLVFALAALPLVLPVISANLSSGLILVGVAFIMIYISSRKRTVFIASILAAAASVVAAFQTGILEKVLDSYQMDRIYAWFDPVAYSSTNGFQTVQGLYAIGSGGLTGRGLGESVQTLGYLPEAQNDMIFSIICEELGLVGASCIIVLFLILIWQMEKVAVSAPDFFGSMIASGIMAHIAIQVLMNIAVVTNTMPNTGVSLPFISYGGSSVLFLMIEIGILLNVSTQIKMEQ